MAVYNATPNAPVAVSAKVNCFEKIKGAKTYNITSGEVTFTNTSGRNIVALEAATSVKCMRGRAMPTVYHYDRLFFQANGLAAGESISGPVEDMGDELFPRDISAAPTPSHATVEIQFVQFEDGSTWGDSSMITQSRARRHEIESFLGQLSSAGSDQEFDSMLDKALSSTKILPHATAYKVSLIRQKAGTKAARADVRERLRVATGREASGKF